VKDVDEMKHWQPLGEETVSIYPQMEMVSL
jgi:hypothetical protein